MGTAVYNWPSIDSPEANRANIDQEIAEIKAIKIG